MTRWFLLLLLLPALPCARAMMPGPEVGKFLVISAPRVALRHVRVIDGTGGAPLADQTVVLVDGRIAAIGPAATTPLPPHVELHDYPGHTVLPGLVGMHDHLFCMNWPTPRKRGASWDSGRTPG